MNSHKCNYENVVRSVTEQLRLNSLYSRPGPTNRAELATAMSVSPSLISQKFNGRTGFTLDDILTLADLFHISVDELLGREPIEARS
ncbi:MAG: Cro/C1-type helix-turn-helix domain protein [Bacteriophage sp.]|nr:MAG: Cro/C1-type helix-turn-helix domain protein [Bacteriophage sp.]